MKNTPELLSPAGTPASVRAAVNGGADAVYFGGKAFNARRGAANMTDQELAEAVAYCHSQEVKVYITLNILIKDTELQALIDYLNMLLPLDIDGLIVQDIGLIYLLKKYFPDFKLQTSTQGSVYGLEGVLFFEREGFGRVVLPREMSIAEAAEIRKQTKTELKIFCHGAICYAYSGQCLMSSMIGGRSGNRGLCAQPCRKKYALADGRGQHIKQGYLLSPKDLKIKDRLAEVVAAGIDSLKIEGRMKTPEYVYAVTRAYRDALDAALGKTTKPSIGEQELAQVFNRSFTQGRLFGDDALIGDALGRNRGVEIGRVKGYENGKLTIAPLPDRTLCVGDGLSFGVDAAKGIRVDVIYDLKNKKLLSSPSLGQAVKVPCRFEVAPGTIVHRNLDAALMQRLKKESTYTQPVTKTPLSFSLVLKLDQSVTGSVKGNGTEADFQSEIKPTKAQKNPLSQEMLRSQFERLGGTEYVLDTLKVTLEDGLFLSKGEINALRREALEALEQGSIVEGPKKAEPIKIDLKSEVSEQPVPDTKQLSLVLTDLLSLEACCSIKAIDELVIPITDLTSPETYRKAVTAAKDAGKKVLLAFPRIMDTKESQTLKGTLDDFLSLGADGVLMGNYEILNLLWDKDIYKEADQSFNVLNGLALNQLKQWRVKGSVLSPELNMDEVADIAATAVLPCVLSVYGRQAIMVSANCPYNCDDRQCDTCKRYPGWATITDERGAAFPLRKDEKNRIHIYNGDILFLRNDLKNQKHIAKWRICATTETPEELKEIADYYRTAMDTDDFENPPINPEVRYTRGNFKRGVE